MSLLTLLGETVHAEMSGFKLAVSPNVLGQSFGQSLPSRHRPIRKMKAVAAVLKHSLSLRALHRSAGLPYDSIIRTVNMGEKINAEANLFYLGVCVSILAQDRAGRLPFPNILEKICKDELQGNSDPHTNPVKLELVR